MNETGAESAESGQKPMTVQGESQRTISLAGLLRTLVPPPPVIPPDISPQILKAVDFLGSRLTETIRVEEAAKEAGLSRFHFIRRFQAEVGETPHRYLVFLRVHLAKQLLVTRPDLRVHEIGRMVGYSDPTAFARVFKTRSGASPQRYRQERLGSALAAAQPLLTEAPAPIAAGEDTPDYGKTPQ